MPLFLLPSFILSCATTAKGPEKAAKAIIVPDLPQEITEIIRYNDALRDGKPVVIKFFSPTCGACRQLEPVMNDIEFDWSDQVVFIHFDTTSKVNRPLARDIGYVPTLRFIDRQGNVHKDLIGVRPTEVILQELQGILTKPDEGRK